MKLPVYLDNNATTPCDPRVVAEMLPYFTEMYGNAASRSHPFGWTAEAAVDNAREQVARLIGAEPTEIIFTSGATESVNLAIKGVFEMYAGKGNHIITAATEHKAVLDTCRHLERNGARVTCMPVDNTGRPDLQALEAAITPQTILLAFMYANNETGVINPVAEIGAIAKKHGVIFLSDATQAAGKIPVNVQTDGIDLLAVSAHKMYGPKGAGALYIRRKSPRVKLIAQIHGGGHERGNRSGTLNVPGIVGLGKACELAMQEMDSEAPRLEALRNRLQEGLLLLDQAYVNGNTKYRLPHVLNISFRYIEGQTLLTGFSKTIALSSGSACTAASLEPSYVLKAMNTPDDLAYASLRFGLGRFTTDEQIDYTIRTVTDTVNTLRAESPLWEMYKDGTYPENVLKPHI
ncbi:IscS subfamily cysteine desulfurase [Chitinophaga solisilvae]|uniref:IscS subfamily cysteine desulfurase n=1 Tax=Chitinophaga solisilvae TaxID=1233460 RepID=UPI00136A6961